jgi:uridine kinase
MHAPARLIAAIRDWQAAVPPPVVIAIDGHGAAGKTTLATEVATTLDAVVLHTDDYFHAAAATCDPQPMAPYYDWGRLRDGALAEALAGASAPILVEGVSAAAPALADLITHTVFVATPEPVRLARLRSRIPPDEWDEDWLAAERVYFDGRPPESFDLIVSGSPESPDTAWTPRIVG